MKTVIITEKTCFFVKEDIHSISVSLGLNSIWLTVTQEGNKTLILRKDIIIRLKEL